MSDNITSKLKLSLYGAIGSLAPDVLILYSKRWTMSSLTFNIWQYIIIIAIYLILSAVVAAIYPYRGKRTPWKAFCIGVSLPVIISGLTTVNRNPEIVSTRGVPAPGTIWDLIRLF